MELRELLNRCRGTRGKGARVSRRMLIAACSTLSLSLGLQAPSALASWSQPSTISTPHALLSGLQLYAGPGSLFAAWTYADTWKMLPLASMAIAPPGQPFGGEQPLGHGYAGRTIVGLGSGRLAQLIASPPTEYTANTYASSLSVALGGTDGVFAAPLHVRASAYLGMASLSGDARGDLLLAWITANARAVHRQVWVSVRPAGGRFSRPQMLSGGAEAEQVRTAVGPRGNMVIAFASEGPHTGIFARTRALHGTWSAAQDLGPTSFGENDITPFVSSSGEIVVTWYHTELDAAGGLYPGYMQVTVRPAGARHFRRAQLLKYDRIGLAGVLYKGPFVDMSPAPILLAAAGGPPLIVFLSPVRQPSESNPYETAVEVSSPEGLRYGAPRSISPAEQEESSVRAAVGPHGVLVSWIRTEPPRYLGGTVFAAVGDPRTGSFAAPEQVSPVERAYSAVPAYDPASDWPANGLAPWIVAWTSRPTLEEFNVIPPAIGTSVRVSSPICPAQPSSSGPAVPAPDPDCGGS